MGITDWGNAPNASDFYGRSNELLLLERWILQEHCKLVMILGIGGVGKTNLSIKFSKGGIGKTDLSLRIAHKMSDKFDFIIWRSLLNAPKFFDISQDIIYFISGNRKYISPDSSDKKLDDLIKYIQKSRCLIILDNLESILENKDGYVAYKEGYETYAEFFQQIGEAHHLSCLLLNGRELPRTMERMCGKRKPVRLLELQGIDEEAGKQLISEQATLLGTDDDWKQLVQFYNGNPLALEIAATHIDSAYFGNISEFLNGNERIFSDILELLDWHFDRLTDREKELLFWLAIEREPVSLIDLRSNILNASSIEQIASTIQSFQRKLPLEKSHNHFTLQPVLMEYATKRFVKQVVTEIQSGELSTLDSYFLCKAHAKDYIREIQSHFIVKPVAFQLTISQSKKQVEKQLNYILGKARKIPSSGYICGNVINILCYLGINLENYNFCGLTVRQAFLQDTTLYGSSFAYCKFFNSVFLATLGTILVVSISSDGYILATGDNKGEIHLWRISDGAKLNTCIGHSSWVRSIAFSPDNALLASCSSDYTVRIWRVSTGECTKIFRGHSEQVYSVSFNIEGNILASAGEDQRVLIWDILEGNQLQSIENFNGRVRSVAFSPKGNILAIADQAISLWDIQKQKVVFNIQPQSKEKYVRKVIFSSDGNILAYIGDGTDITLWNIESKRCINIIHHTSRLWCIDFSPNGKFIASAGDDNKVQIWDIQLNQIFAELQGHSASIKSISFSSKDNIIISGGDDQSVKIWDYSKKPRGQILRTIKGYANAIRSVAFSKDGKHLISGGEDGMVRLWDIELETTQAKVIKIFKGHYGTIQSVSFGPKDDIFVSGGNDATIRVWNIKTEQCLLVLNGHRDWVWTVTFSHDGNWIAAGSRDYSISLWDVSTGRLARNFIGHIDEIHSVAISPNGEILASGSDDNTIKLWDISTGNQVASLDGHSDCVRSVVFSPDGNILASGSDDQTIKLWDMCNMNQIAVLEGHSNRVRTVVFNDIGDRLYSSSDDQTIKEWSLISFQSTYTYGGHSNAVWTLDYNSATKVIASGSEDETIRLWLFGETTSQRILRPMRPYEGMNIYESTGITNAQKDSLLNLGALQDYMSMDAILEENENSFPDKKQNLSMEPFTILFLSANPSDTSRLRLDEEAREIREKLQLAKLRDQFCLEHRTSVRPSDISQALLDIQPKIVHFSGHGTSSGALFFEDRIGEAFPVNPEALATLFEQFTSSLKCVILNACYSEIQAIAIVKHIDFVIGMSEDIGDKAAISFSIGFYQGLGAGRTVKEAYKLGCSQIGLQGIPEHLTPVLIERR